MKWFCTNCAWEGNYADLNHVMYRGHDWEHCPSCNSIAIPERYEKGMTVISDYWKPLPEAVKKEADRNLDIYGHCFIDLARMEVVDPQRVILLTRDVSSVEISKLKVEKP